MKNGEVFNADSRCDLIVNNAINYRCADTCNGYFEGFHALPGFYDSAGRLNWRKIPDYTQDPVEEVGLY
jgi:hypothetical protein